MWMLILSNAVAIVGLVVALWRLQSIESFARAEAAKLRAHLASLPFEDDAARRTLGRQRIVLLGNRGRPAVPQRSGLDEFPEEKSLDADASASQRSVKTG
jgi:hypothetical protein